ncbi:carboxy terminal-processing peptidase [Pelomonas sp. Root1217]|uniref:carboxy terminal-processing peptidase n=1 Tax=Pelomonas sp. Root1217 TaxID=1736430 RepID=UPI0009E8C14A|nr:carboxy terminal-processing peptidase [Pelomonas sp. Root1217]
MTLKQALISFVLVLTAATQVVAEGSAAAFPQVLKPEAQQAKSAHLAADLLSRYHYRPLSLDDALSARIFDQYLKALDPEKLYFLQSDIDRLSGDRILLDDAILAEDLRVPFEVFNLYERRVAERLTYGRTLLKKGFDFGQDESLTVERKDQPWPATEAESQDLWRKRVKNEWLRLKLAGRDDPAIVKILDKRYESASKNLGKITSADAFQAFMNAYTMAIDPHTNYLGPRAAENFDISMRLSLVGIGALLTQIDDYATVRELVPGGPASLSGQLKVGDRIVGVAQGATGAMEDVVGRRLDDTVALIRGMKGSTVRLDVLPADSGPDAPNRTVVLVRNTITVQDSAAKAKIYSVTTGAGKRLVGVITLPSFYEDTDALRKGDKDYRGAANDVGKLLFDMKAQKVDGVLIDLRNDGGGSLRQAVNLTGMFVGKLPVVQTRDARGNITVEKNAEAGLAWSGPLGVLINRGSASASEIFAAAIQDYGRGVIIGEGSFGKGTVQTLANLDQIAKNAAPTYGELKFTIAQFFRVNGGTTQLRGVTPDILFPQTSDDTEFGESSYVNALPWTNIRAVDYSPVGDVKTQLPRLLAWHAARVEHALDFQNLLQDVAKAQERRKNNVISLSESVRRKERAASEKRLAARLGEAERGASGTLVDDGLQFNERQLDKDLAAEKTRKTINDALLDEAVSILSDSAALKEGQTQTAASALPIRPQVVMTLPKVSSEK